MSGNGSCDISVAIQIIRLTVLGILAPRGGYKIVLRSIDYIENNINAYKNKRIKYLHFN